MSKKKKSNTGAGRPSVSDEDRKKPVRIFLESSKIEDNGGIKECQKAGFEFLTQRAEKKVHNFN